MTVQNQNVKNVYRGNGSTTVFPFTFAINESHPEYIHVYITNDGGKAAETTDFTCDMETRTITYPKVSSSAPKLSATQRLTIYRLLPYEQNLNLVNQGPFFSEDVETQLDDLEMQIQQLNENLVRCFQIGIEAQDFDMTMELEPGKVICVNSEGNGFEARDALLEVNGAWDGEGRQIKGVADPTAAQDAVTKNYVDTLTDNNFMKLQPGGAAWEGRNLPIRNVGGPVLVKDAATKDYVDRILEGYSGQGERFKIFDNVAQMKAADLIPSQVVATQGYTDINDGGASVYTIRTKTQSDVDDGGSIIFLANGNVAELITDGTVNVKQFGAKGDGTTDDSTPMQNMVNFAKASGIDVVDINCDVAFKEVELSANITLDFHEHIAQGIRYGTNANITQNMFSSTANDIDVIIKNAKFRGYRDVGDSGTKYPCVAKIDIVNANNVQLLFCSFTNFDENWYSAPLVAGFLYRVTDCKNFLLSHCYFNDLTGEEIGWCTGKELDRTEINAVYEYNTFGDNINTSAFDFLGNNCVLRGNVYNYDYAGSVVNCFGLNVDVSNETFNGTVHNCYDNCEEIYFQGDSFRASNIAVANAVSTSIFMLSAQVVDIGYAVLPGKCVVTMRKGYGGTPDTFPYQGSAPLDYVNVNIHDIITTDGAAVLNNTETGIFGDHRIVLKNCTIGAVVKPILPYGGTLIIDGCKCSTIVDSGFGGVPVFCKWGTSGGELARNPANLIVKNCYFKNVDTTASEYIFAGKIANVIFDGNISDSTAGDNVIPNTANITNGWVVNNIGINNVGQIPSA